MGRPIRWSDVAVVVGAAVAPCTSFFIGALIADRYVEFGSVDPGGFVTALPLYFVFISLPALFPVAAAPAGPFRWMTLLAMSIVALVAGVLVVATDDAQAGLAVLWVPIIAVPLGLAIVLTRVSAKVLPRIADSWTSRRPSQRRDRASRSARNKSDGLE